MAGQAHAIAVCIAFGCSGSSRPVPLPVPSPSPTVEVVQPSTSDTVVLHALDVELGTVGDLASKGPRFEDRVRRYRAFVRDRLTQDAFFKTFLVRLFPNLFSEDSGAAVPLTLQTGQFHGAPFYYLDKPCAPPDLVNVRPWWDDAHDVAICKDSYRPELTVDQRTGSSVSIFCEYYWLPSVESRPRVCRCGARLLSCARDEQQAAALASAMSAEPRLTTAAIVRSHQPFSRILTSEETVRSGLADFIYNRSEFYRSGKFELAADRPAGWHPREAAFGGGILSTAHTMFLFDSQRVIGGWIWEDFLCIPLRSTDVHASQMFQMKSANFRHAGHMDLAEMEGCRTCHARLENVLQVFAPVTPVKHGIRFDLDAKPLSAKFFGTDDSDQRGEGPATFAWLGEMITKQPEFKSCIVKKVEDLVYGGLEIPADVHTTLASRFAEGMDLARLFEDSVVARYLGYPALAIAR